MLPPSNGAPAFEQRVARLEAASKDHDTAIGELLGIAKDLRDLAKSVRELGLKFDLVIDRVGIVGVKAEAAQAKADLADAKAERASFTNEIEGPPSKSDRELLKSDAPPEEKIAAKAGAAIAVDIVRSGRARLVAGVALLLALAFGGGRVSLQSCSSKDAPAHGVDK